MKIQKLIIHNIASIEDATINFAVPPLATEPLFLITGETGSGKTTILNAICLALYNTAPNLKQIGSAEEDREGIQTNNPRQLMRRGTAEAWIELSIEGNDEKNYEVSWNLRRARNKTTGNLQNVKRSLYCKETKITLQKDNEIKDAIHHIIGLTFEQFCRTTMLAQGEFSKFMNSEEKDKAEILEKLTETDIYTKIGKKIFEISKTKNIAFERLNSEIQGARLLSEEIKTAYRQKIIDLTERYNSQIAQIQIIDQQLHWLLEFKTKQEALQIGMRELQILEAQSESEKVQNQRKTLQTWNATNDIRNLLKIKKTEEETLQTQQQQLDDKAREFMEYLAGFNGIRTKYQQIKQEINIRRQQFENEQIHVSMYNATDQILSHIQNLNQKTAALQTYFQQITEHQQNIKQLKIKISNTKETIQKAEQTYLKQTQQVHELRETCAAINLQEIADSVRSGNEKINQLTQTINTLKNYLEKNADYITENQLYQKTKQQLEAQILHATTINHELTTSNQQLLILENQYKGKQDLSDHITELQIQFQDTHTCPLCGSHVNTLLTKQILKDSLQRAKQQRDEALSKRDEIQEAAAQTKANVIQLKTACKHLQEKLQTKQELLEKLTKQVILQTQILKLDYRAENTLSTLEIWLKQTQEANERNIEKQKQANTQQEKLQQAELHLSQGRINLDKIQKQHQEIQEKINQLTTQTAHQKGQSEQTQKDIQTIQTTLRQLITIPIDWDSIDYTALKNTIQRKAQDYFENKEKLISLTQQTDLLSTEIETATDTINTLKTTFPQIQNTTAKEIPHLNQLLRNFSIQINLLQGIIQQVKSNLENTQIQIKQYFHTHNEHTEEQIKQLLLLSPYTIENYKLKLEQLHNDILQKKGAYEQLKNLLQAHNTIKPTIPAEATIDTLSAEKKALDTLLQQTNEEKVTLQTKLQDNENHLHALANKKAELELLRHERNNWEQLDRIFGGSQGDKFKRIAQSYVLKSLLQKANYYLNMLSNRYELECNDGSLTINVIDHHQGDAIRNVGLLSGGESFIVSLALALGLSAISKNKIHVDTLFIDEGFGTLSNEHLETVINTLDRLHQIGGRRVGIISHVAELTTRIHTQIQLKRTGPSSSKIEIISE